MVNINIKDDNEYGGNDNDNNYGFRIVQIDDVSIEEGISFHQAIVGKLSKDHVCLDTCSTKIRC